MLVCCQKQLGQVIACVVLVVRSSLRRGPGAWDPGPSFEAGFGQRSTLRPRDGDEALPEIDSWPISPAAKSNGHVGARSAIFRARGSSFSKTESPGTPTLTMPDSSSPKELRARRIDAHPIGSQVLVDGTERTYAAGECCCVTDE
jgi:hypothetical protein